jgi:hypothetical protein
MKTQLLQTLPALLCLLAGCSTGVPSPTRPMTTSSHEAGQGEPQPMLLSELLWARNSLHGAFVAEVLEVRSLTPRDKGPLAGNYVLLSLSERLSSGAATPDGDVWDAGIQVVGYYGSGAVCRNGFPERSQKIIVFPDAQTGSFESPFEGHKAKAVGIFGHSLCVKADGLVDVYANDETGYLSEEGMISLDAIRVAYAERREAIIPWRDSVSHGCELLNCGALSCFFAVTCGDFSSGEVPQWVFRQRLQAFYMDGSTSKVKSH